MIFTMVDFLARMLLHVHVGRLDLLHLEPRQEPKQWSN